MDLVTAATWWEQSMNLWFSTHLLNLTIWRAHRTHGAVKSPATYDMMRRMNRAPALETDPGRNFQSWVDDPDWTQYLKQSTIIYHEALAQVKVTGDLLWLVANKGTTLGLTLSQNEFIVSVGERGRRALRSVMSHVLFFSPAAAYHVLE